MRGQIRFTLYLILFSSHAQAEDLSRSTSAKLTLPVGTLIAFGGTVTQAEAQQSGGWWIADGRTINDSVSPMNGTQTPDLRKRFVLGGDTAGQIGGAASIEIPQSRVVSYMTGHWGPNYLNVDGTGKADPKTVISGPATWVIGNPIETAGTTSKQTISYSPPYFSVIYLIKVK